MASRFLAVLFIAAFARQALGTCSYGTFLHPRAEEGGQVPISTFGYVGEKGPLNWVALNPETNQVCATGKRQSPIDMVDGTFQMVSASDIQLTIPDMTEGTDFENLGTTVEVIAKGGQLVVANMTYSLKQFHFHLPSEHLDNGTSIAMEMHMVWQTTNREIAVIGVFVDLDNGGAAATVPGAAPATTAAPARKLRPRGLLRRESTSTAPPVEGSFGGQQAFLTTPMLRAAGVSSTLLETVFANAGQIATPGTAVKTAPLIMSELVNTLLAGSFKCYSGSLTTPPCSEGVRWLVATQKLQIQTATFERVRSVIGFNSRFPQNTPGQPNVLQLGALAAKNQTLTARAPRSK